MSWTWETWLSTCSVNIVLSPIALDFFNGKSHNGTILMGGHPRHPGHRFHALYNTKESTPSSVLLLLPYFNLILQIIHPTAFCFEIYEIWRGGVHLYSDVHTTKSWRKKGPPSPSSTDFTSNCPPMDLRWSHRRSYRWQNVCSITGVQWP